jgi:hypothetical protein
MLRELVGAPERPLLRAGDSARRQSVLELVRVGEAAALGDQRVLAARELADLLAAHAPPAGGRRIGLPGAGRLRPLPTSRPSRYCRSNSPDGFRRLSISSSLASCVPHVEPTAAIRRRAATRCSGRTIGDTPQPARRASLCPPRGRSAACLRQTATSFPSSR